MRPRHFPVGRLLLSAILFFAVVGCDDDEPDAGCSTEAAHRVLLTATGSPAPDVSELAMCTDDLRSKTIITNGTGDVWLAQVPPQAAITLTGQPSAPVRIFRLIVTSPAIPGRWFEPGTAVRISTAPERVSLKIDPELQSQWSTLTLIDKTVTAAKDNLPRLIQNVKYKNAVTSCLAAGSRTVNALTGNTQTLVENLGLVNGLGRCAADLRLAEQERQAIALRDTGHNLTELKPATFAAEASSIASELDKLLDVMGRFAHA